MSSGRWAALGALAVLLVGLGLSCVVAESAEAQTRELANVRFSNATDRVLTDLLRRLELPAYGLRGGRGMLNTHEASSRWLVQQYVRSRNLDVEFPGVRGIGFIEVVERADLPAFLVRQRADGAPDFAVTTRRDDDDPLYVITTIEPLERNRAAWGFDVGSEPRRRAALESAIDTGLSMTAPVPLLQGESLGPGALIVLPVFAPSLPASTPEERRRALRGFFYVPLIAQELFAGTNSAAEGLIDFDLYDVTEGEPELVYDADRHVARRVRVRTSAFSQSRLFEYGGRTLRLDTFALPLFEAEYQQSLSSQRRWQGYLLSVVCALVVWLLGRSRSRALSLADAMTRDLSEAKRSAERALQENDALYRTLNTHFLVSTADRGGRILSVNHAMCALSGYSEAELVGATHSIVNSGHHPKRFWAEMWKTVLAGQMWRGEVCNRKKDGSLYWVDTLIAPLVQGEGQGTRFISIRADITARKHAEAELERQTKVAHEFAQHAAEANHAKSSFLANMSHEIRTPMNGVLGMTELLLGMGLTQEQEETARTVYRSADALLVILNDILDFSKIEAGKLDYERLRFDLPQVVYDTVELFKGKVAGREVELLVRIAPDAPLEVWGDPTRVRQVVLNLLGNAVKFTTRGHVMVELERLSEHFVLRVVDTGPGIPPDRQGRLFQPFTQADASMSRRHGGTGLGLAISRRLAHGMGGDLTLRSVMGEGSTFELTLPLEEATPPGTDLRLVNRRVLVAEPSTPQRCILLEQLTAAGAVVEGVSTLEAVQASLAAHAFDVVLWADALVPPEWPANVGHVVQLAGRPRGGGVLSVPRPCRTSVLAEVVLEACSRARGAPVDAPVVSISAPTPAPRSIRAAVLVVDDNPINLRVASAMLERLGCRVSTAANGRAAIEAWQGAPWDAIFMDCQMPEVDGYEATAQIRALEADRKRTPIIAMTANAGAEDRVRCLSAGMDGFIAKPCRSRDFEEVLAQWITLRAA